MNREGKHQLVIKLYKEGKTMRQIAKEVHMSFGDIGSITKKLNQESEPKIQEKSKESQALELFKKGKNPVDVSIAMDLTPSEVVQIYYQFLELRGLYRLLDLYRKVNADSYLLMKVYEVVKKYDLSKKDIINIVDYADKRIFLKEEVDGLGMQFTQLIKQRHIANDSLMATRKKQTEMEWQVETYEKIIKQKLVRIENLKNEIEKLENQISLLREGDEYYVKFEQTAREKLDLILKERRWILTLALDAVIESLKKDIENKTQFNDTSLDKIDRSKQLDLTEQLFDKLLKELIDGTSILNEDQDISPVYTQNQFDQSYTKQG